MPRKKARVGHLRISENRGKDKNSNKNVITVGIWQRPLG